MRPIKQTRYGFPARAPAKRKSRQEIFRPTFGLHSGDVPQDLPPGFTPQAQNFVTERGYITPRSGLSQFGAYSFGRPVLGGSELFDISGALAAVASSASTIGFYHSSADSWSELSYVRGSTLTVDDLPSGTSRDYWSIANIYDSQTDAYIAVLSNGTNTAKFFEVASDTTTYSDFTFAESLASTKAAKAVFAINDRLCFFNVVDSAGTKYPTRVLWSARGNPRSFAIADGAGFEDLMGMKGEGLTAVRYADVVVLFTHDEVWIARPTLDDYAFRFDRLSDNLGCPWPRSAVATPIGVIFLGHDKEFYVVSGNGLSPLGPAAAGEPSRVQMYLADRMIEGERAWAVYNANARRYEFYFTTNESTEGFPIRALYYNIDDRSWMPQVFSHELTFGFDFDDPGTFVSWDALEGLTWDEMVQGWDSVGASADERWITTFGSGGTAYRLRTDQPDDDGTAIDARWRSHGLNQRDQMRQVHLTEVWVDYQATSDSSATLHVSDDLGASFDSGTAMNLKATERNAFVPVWLTAQAPMFELRIGDGTKPKIGRFQATLADAGRMHGGR